MSYDDLALAIIRFAESRSKNRGGPVWGAVMEILCCGKSKAMGFCAEFLPQLGWNRTAEKTPPEAEFLYAVEDLGDGCTKLLLRNGVWYDSSGAKMLYTIRWWKPAVKRTPRA